MDYQYQQLPSFPARLYRYPALVVWLCTAVLISRFFWVVTRYAVNLFFYDEWGIYSGLFDRAPWYHFFLEQSGPHRQGLGVMVVASLLKVTRWDSRIQAYVIAAALVCAAVIAIRLKTKLLGPLRVSDAVIAMIFLGLGQWEVLLSAPGPSAQAFPLLLLVLYCLAWTQARLWHRYAGIVIANFFLIYTGYGIFTAPITLLLLSIDFLRRIKADRNQFLAPLSALIASLLSLAAFFHGYVFNPAAQCFEFPYRSPSAYPAFMALMFAKFLGIKHGFLVPVSIGAIVLLILSAVFLRNCLITWQRGFENQTAMVVVILTGYTLLYAASAAIGRVCFGMQAAGASRNLTLLIPGFLGTYFHLLTNPTARQRTVLVPVFLLAIAPCCIQRYHKEIEGFATMKREWKQCYRATENISYCDNISHLQLFPWPDLIHLHAKLDYLKQNHLNLYANNH